MSIIDEIKILNKCHSELENEIQKLRKELNSACESMRDLEKKQTELFEKLLTEDSRYYCPNCDNEMKLKSYKDSHFGAITYGLECSGCGLVYPSTSYKDKTLMNWYEFINKIRNLKEDKNG